MSVTTNTLNKSSPDFTVDNIFIDGNAITTLNVNGNLNIEPNGLGIISQTKTTVGGNVGQLTKNADNTNLASDAYQQVTVGGTSGGDPYFTVGIGDEATPTQAYAWGIDNSASDVLKEVGGSGSAINPSSGTILRQMTSAGQQTLPLQPSFFAFVNAAITNVTGNGTQYVIASNWQESYDIGSNFNAGTGVFTTPVAGKYQFNATINMEDLTGVTSLNYQFLYGGSVAYFHEATPAPAAASGRYGASGSLVVSLAASANVSLRVQGQGAGGDTADVSGAASPFFTYFSGCLIA